MPAIGVLKCTDEVADIVKQADNISDAIDGIGDVARQAEIIVEPSAFVNEGELANTIAHELNHARSWFNNGIAPEDSAYAAGDAIGGVR